MKRVTTVLCTLVLFAFSVLSASAATIGLYNYAFNEDGIITEEGFPTLGDPMPSGILASGFGTLNFTVTGVGSHFVGVFLDYEIDEAINTYYNEFGASTGAPEAGQTWEIDEPGWVFGDIYDHFDAYACDPGDYACLDNANAVPEGFEDDVSIALGWDFDLIAGEEAFVQFFVSDSMPTSGFYLSQTDPESFIPGTQIPATIYFSSKLTIRDEGPNGYIPEPGTWILMLTGLALTSGIAAKRSRKRSE